MDSWKATLPLDQHSVKANFSGIFVNRFDEEKYAANNMLDKGKLYLKNDSGTSRLSNDRIVFNTTPILDK